MQNFHSRKRFVIYIFQKQCTVLCKSNANVFRRNSRLFLAFRRKKIEFSMEAKFQRKVTIIREAYCFQLREFSNDNSFGTTIDFDFSSEKSLCSINYFEHVSEISLFISSARTFPSILLTTSCQVRSCRDDSFALSSHKGEACLFTKQFYKTHLDVLQRFPLLFSLR